jgi:hypothetical protein
VLLTEYNAKHQRKLDRRDARAEGRTEGRIQGRAQGRAEMIEQMLISGKTPEEISSFTGVPLSEIKAVEKSVRVNVP